MGGASPVTTTPPSDVCLIVLRKLPTFVPRTADSFTRFVSAICKRCRLAGLDRSIAAKRFVSYDDDAEQGYTEDSFPSLDGLEPWQREYAEHLLAGYSIDEAAQEMGYSPAALRQRLHRARRHKVRR